MGKIFVAPATNTSLGLLRMQQFTSTDTLASITDPTTLHSRSLADRGLIVAASACGAPPQAYAPTRADLAPRSRRHWPRALFDTDAHLAPALARVALGATILPHGAQKLFGWFGGYGFTGTMNWFTGTMHVPWVLGVAAILAETMGGLLLIIGLGSRLAAASIAAVFVTATALVHWQHGFFANWFGNQKGEGIEYFILGLTLAAIVMMHGGGAASLDRALARKKAGRRHP
jgi:putative oxidoreductase